MQLAWANEANLCDDQRVITVSVDGQRRTMKPGETLVLKPGQGICRRVCIIASGRKKRLFSAGKFRW